MARKLRKRRRTPLTAIFKCPKCDEEIPAEELKQQGLLIKGQPYRCPRCFKCSASWEKVGDTNDGEEELH